MKTVRPRVTFEGDLLRDALAEYLSNRGIAVRGHVEVLVSKGPPMPGHIDKGCVILEWSGEPIEKGRK